MASILSFGEILWDIFPDYKKPGGSPANLAYHLYVLGNRSNLVSRVGNDLPGRELTGFISQKGLSIDYIQTDKNLPTGTVSVTFEAEKPSYTIHNPSAWDFIDFNEEVREISAQADAVCFASLSQRSDKSAKTLHRILKNTKPGCLKIFDMNLRKPFIDKEMILRNIFDSDVVKLNEDELSEVKKWVDTDDLPGYILHQYPKKIILTTMGAQGSALISSSGEFKKAAFPISGQGDFVGVGDAFLACVSHLLLQNEPHGQILEKANYYASLVASKKGGMPDIPDDVIQKIKA